MDSDEKPKGNSAKILAAVFAVITVGFGVIGVIDLISAEGNVLDNIIPDGMKDIFAYVELGAALLFLVISIVVFSLSKKEASSDEDDLSSFENNVFNYKENQKQEVSKRYEQPKDEFPEEIPEEYKKFMQSKDVSDRYLSKEDIGKDKTARPIYTPKSDDEYINQMGDEFEAISDKEDIPVKETEVPEISETVPFTETITAVDNVVEDEVSAPKVINNIYESNAESVSVDIDTNSIDISALETAQSETVVYETETLDTGDIDTSTLEVNSSVSNEYEHEVININSIDFSALETVSNNTVYKYDELDSDAIDTSRLENVPVMDTSGYFTDEINSTDIDSSHLEDAKPAFTYAYEETESISLDGNSLSESTSDYVYDTSNSIDVFDVGIYEESTEQKAPKVYDFAKKAAELAASKTADDEGKTSSHTSSYLNAYLESFSSKPSANTLYSASADNSNNNSYNPVYDDENYNTGSDYVVAEQPDADVSNDDSQKSNLDSLLDSFTFGKK